MNDQYRLRSNAETLSETVPERADGEPGTARNSRRGDGLVWTLLGVSIAVNAALSVTGSVIASAAVGTLALGLATMLVVRHVKRSR